MKQLTMEEIMGARAAWIVALLCSSEALAQSPPASQASPPVAPHAEPPRGGARATTTGTTKMELKTGLVFVWMKPGKYIFGCDPGTPCEKTRKTSKAPTEMAGFWLMRGRVTVAEYNACVAAGACSPRGEGQFCPKEGPSYPATCVAFPQAEAFCSWIDAGLPTAMQWEFAADSGFDMNWEYGFDFNGHKHGAIEWVRSQRSLEKGYAATRGGVADVAPTWPSDEGDARVTSQFSELGFRCAQPIRVQER